MCKSSEGYRNLYLLGTAGRTCTSRRQTGDSCGAGGDFGGGLGRLSATTFAGPGVWWRSLVNSEI